MGWLKAWLKFFKGAPRMEVGQLEQALANGACLLDVREFQETRAGMIPGAMVLPFSQLRARLFELPKDRDLIVYCQSGARSAMACRILANAGFVAHNLAGGYQHWQRSR